MFKSPANAIASIIDTLSLGIVNFPGFLTSPKTEILKLAIVIITIGFLT